MRNSLPVYQQSHDQQPNLGMSRGEAGADHGSAHRRNGPYYDTARKRGGFIHDAYRLGLLCPNTFGPSHQFTSPRPYLIKVPRVGTRPTPFAGSGGDIDRHLILKRRKPSPARRIALLLPAIRHLSPANATSLDGGNWGAFIAAPSFFELRKHFDRQVSNAAPSHLNRLSCGCVERHYTTTARGQKIGFVAQRTRHPNV